MNQVPVPRTVPAKVRSKSDSLRGGSDSDLCVCFDMDGLLVNTEPMWWRAESELMIEFGGTWTDEDGRACVGGPLEKVADLILGRTGRKSSHLNTAEVIDLLIGRMDELLRSCDIALMPGATQLLTELHDRGFRIALVSASPRVLVDAVLSSIAPVSDIFDFSISCDDVAVSKPDPAPYRLAAEKFNIPTSKMLVLEDSPTGVQSAVTAGAAVIAVPHLVEIRPSERVHVVDSLTEVSWELIEALTATAASNS